MRSPDLLKKIGIVLVRPLYPGNIGSVARAMKNMGLSRLTLVEPADPRSAEAYRMAYGAADVLEKARVVNTLSDAVSKVRFVVGTTVRRRKGCAPLLPLSQVVPKILSCARRQQVVVVFGSERIGLTNEELGLCRELAVIPMASRHPSLNLAQAVVIVLYELLKGLGQAGDAPERLMAAAGEMERFYQDLEDVLSEIRFVKGPQGRFIMTSLRRIFNRAALDSREVRILRGVLRQVRWAGGRRPPSSPPPSL